MITMLFAEIGPTVIGLLILSLCAALAAMATLPRWTPAAPSPALDAGWPALAQRNHRPLIMATLGALLLASLASGLSVGLIQGERAPAGLATRDFALVEREFLYRERLNERIVDRLQQAHDQEMRQLREGYESQLEALRSRYQEAYEQMTQNNEQLVRSIAAQYGLDADFFARVSGVESGFDSTVANPESGARGLFQFMPRTWNGIGDQFGDDIHAAGAVFEPVTRENAGTEQDPRNDARLNTIMGALLTRLNIESVRSTDPAIVYLAHFAGPEMASYVNTNLNTNPEELIRAVVRRIMPGLAEAVIEQNAPAYEETTTLRDFYQFAASRFADIETALSPDSELVGLFPNTAGSVEADVDNQTPAATNP